ncbi:HNH endonuclease [bacterium]|nr:HNH endonuclease [bacterium]
MTGGAVLVLNRSFLPIHITDVKKALCLLYRGLAKVVDHEYSLVDFLSWMELSAESDKESIGLVNRTIRIPRVILLTFYDKIPTRTVRFSRLNVFLRDNNTCQYCQKRFSKSGLNLDHVVPVSHGGKTNWENVVCSCVPCNIKKGGRTPQQAGMALMKQPIKPHWSIILRLLSRPRFHEAWKPFLNMIDYSYWNVELAE